MNMMPVHALQPGLSNWRGSAFIRWSGAFRDPDEELRFRQSRWHHTAKTLRIAFAVVLVLMFVGGAINVIAASAPIVMLVGVVICKLAAAVPILTLWRDSRDVADLLHMESDFLISVLVSAVTHVAVIVLNPSSAPVIGAFAWAVLGMIAMVDIVPNRIVLPSVLLMAGLTFYGAASSGASIHLLVGIGLAIATTTVTGRVVARRSAIMARQQYRLLRESEQARQLLGATHRALESSQQELVRQASTDFLTGIMNRRSFLRKAEELFASRKSNTILMMIDIDHFKRVNDEFGHASGDAVLRGVCAIVGGELPFGYWFGRLGGEEFAVVSNLSDLDTAVDIGEAIVKKVGEAPIRVFDRDVPVTLSIGLTVRLPKDKSVQQLLERADRALYYAKRSGRNRLVRDDALAGRDEPSSSTDGLMQLRKYRD